MASESKVWLITSASKSASRAAAEDALSHGDRVVATASDPWSLDDLAARYPRRFVALALDPTDEGDTLRTILQARSHFGRLDVVVDDAVESAGVGGRAVAKAVLPILRMQRAGHLVQIAPGSGLPDDDVAALADAGVRVTFVEREGVARAASDRTGVDPIDGALASRPEVHADTCSIRDRIAGFFGIEPEMREARATARAIRRVVASTTPPVRVAVADPASRGASDRAAGWAAIASVATAALVLFRT